MVQLAAAWVAGASLLADATPSWSQDYPTREILAILVPSIFDEHSDPEQLPDHGAG
jgi:hypothetical protein